MLGEISQTKVIEWVDIQASRQAVFDLLMNVERRMQLSPLWGFTRLEALSPDFPKVGSRNLFSLVKPESEEESAPGEGDPDKTSHYETEIIEYVPGRKLSYRLASGSGSQITWKVQDSAQGARLTYEEIFSPSSENPDEFIRTVQQTVKQWLGNIKRYSELRDSRVHRTIRWALDRYYLKLSMPQRRVIQTVLFMQLVGTISFAMAALAMGVAHFLS